MTGSRPDDERVLLSDTERDQMVDALRRHLADGRLDLATFEERVAAVLAAKRRGEADQAFVDLPLLPPSGRVGRRRRRGAPDDGPQPGWRPTDEVFRDPSSGRLTRVWMEPGTGSRHYLPD